MFLTYILSFSVQARQNRVQYCQPWVSLLQLKSSGLPEDQACSRSGRSREGKQRQPVISYRYCGILSVGCLCSSCDKSGVLWSAHSIPFPHFKSWFMERPRLRTKELVILLVCCGVNNLFELLTWDFRSFRVSCALWVPLHFCDITFLRFPLHGSHITALQCS